MAPAGTGFFGVRLVLELLEAHDDQGGAPTPADVPHLAVPMHVARAGDRIQVWLERPDWLTDTSGIQDGHNTFLCPYCEPCDWVDANVITGEYSFEKFWKRPRPQIAAALTASAPMAVPRPSLESGTLVPERGRATGRFGPT